MATEADEPAARIIREPRVYLVGRQAIDDAALGRFLDDHGVSRWSTDTDEAGERLVEVAGRLCYMSFAKPRPGGNAAYIGHILEVGHGSVLEHAVFNLVIAGVSRSFTHELVRHRAGFGYSQLSQRFVDESTCDFVEPDAIAADPDLHRVWLDAIGHSQRAYRELAEGLMEAFADVEDRTSRRKKAREAARSVLPNATETKIFVTANARALRHFIEMRGDVAADAEIRKVALAVLTLLQAESPNLFGDYTIVDLPDGGRAATTPHRKV
ncbi:MAG TPA: FAD-dependent thymidylate synthase [Isosphaeraceae bacterium]|jgi:thymidylate synthase (FAD)|nr:FAD-dependent thymidylate synthase [Isosphaeraceae bacterium]